MTTLRIARMGLAAGLASAVLVMAAPADAAVCAARSISATGKTAQFGVLARLSARSVWSSKVARDPRTGSSYSRWLASSNRRLICRKVDRRHVCLAIAIPCRQGRAAVRADAGMALASPLSFRS